MLGTPTMARRAGIDVCASSNSCVPSELLTNLAAGTAKLSHFVTHFEQS